MDATKDALDRSAAATVENDLASLESAVRTATAGLRLLGHPFYRRWESGQLHRDELASYAGQYRHFETFLPMFLRRLAGSLDAGPARAAVEANVRDEEGDPVPHVQLFDDFAAAVGASDRVPPRPATTRLLEAYEAERHRSAGAALAGLVAYEHQAPDVARTKADALRHHYGVSGSGVAFWDHHARVDVAHARWTLEALIDLGETPQAVARASTRVATAWWEFLDQWEPQAASA